MSTQKDKTHYIYKQSEIKLQFYSPFKKKNLLFALNFPNFITKQRTETKAIQTMD